MTYPHPSQKYQELVCTAGITDRMVWVRLYPIDYRYRSEIQKFHKYQWIEIELWPNGDKNDRRKESRKPVLDSPIILGERLTTDNDWADRRAIIDRMPHSTHRELVDAYKRDMTSLGIIRPKRILDLEIRPAESVWKPESRRLYDQPSMFDPPLKPLEKIPYSFHYIYECDDDDKPHSAMCEDWELGVLFLKERDRLGSDTAAAESVKTKFLGELCHESRETRFFVGTFFPYNTWLVLGVFWPPRRPHTLPTLFDDVAR
jgi:hypothetical protein